MLNWGTVREVFSVFAPPQGATWLSNLTNLRALEGGHALKLQLWHIPISPILKLGALMLVTPCLHKPRCLLRMQQSVRSVKRVCDPCSSPYLLHLLQCLRAGLSVGGVASQLLEVQAILLQVAGHVLTRHSIHIHQLKNGLGHSILDALQHQRRLLGCFVLLDRQLAQLSLHSLTIFCKTPHKHIACRKY